VKIVFSESTRRSATNRIVAARSRSSLITAHGAWWSTYWLPMLERRIASASAALNFASSIKRPTDTNPASISARARRSSSVNGPGSGTSPNWRYAFVNVRLTRLPQLASSSSFDLRTNSSQVNSVSWVSGLAATR